MKTKKLFILIFSLLFTRLYSLDISKINIDEYKISPQSTSGLVSDKEGKELNIYKENNDIYILGWSKDGKMAYIENRSIEGRGGYDFYFIIIDLVEDKITYQFKKQWYDNDDYGESPQKRLTFQQCIKVYSKEINKQLKATKIIVKPCEFQNFPAKDSKGKDVKFDVKITKKETGEFNFTCMSYEIYASKDNQSKLINSVDNKRCEYVKATGYLKSPYEDRVALIIADSEYVFEGNEVFISFYGCNLSSGFRSK